MSEHPAPALVLDTNTVLDWLLFSDPCMAALGAAVQAGAVRWVACPRMRDEFQRTLGYPALQKWKPDSERLLSLFDAAAAMLPAPPTLPALRCSDADDQVFLDLAVAAHARWLVTHDKALLRLARRARTLNLHVIKPASWVLE